MMLNTTPKQLKIDYIKIFQSNYLWVASSPSDEGVVVFDPGSAKELVAFLTQTNQKIASILITHSHWDHITDLGKVIDNDSLWLNPRKKRIIGPSCIEGINLPATHNDTINLWETGDIQAQVIATPGHMPEHLCYFLPQTYDVAPLTTLTNHTTGPILICGDVLFSMGCGRILKGTAKELMRSLEQLAALPDETLVFCSHEYTQANLDFALSVIEDLDYRASLNAYLFTVKRAVNTGNPTLPSCIATEKSLNPFLRCYTSELKQSVEKKTNHQYDDSLAVFSALRQLKDQF